MPKISLVQKKIIKSLLYGNYDIMGIYFARIYTLGRDSKFWLYSGLEGALIYCIDVRPRVLRFLLFNLKTYEIVFDCELYKRFNQSFQKGTDNFFYFNVNVNDLYYKSISFFRNHQTFFKKNAFFSAKKSFSPFFHLKICLF